MLSGWSFPFQLFIYIYTRETKKIYKNIKFCKIFGIIK